MIIGCSVAGGALLLGGGVGVPLAVRSNSAKNRRINAEKLLSQSRTVPSNPNQVGKNGSRGTNARTQENTKNVKVNKQTKSNRIQTNQTKQVGQTRNNRFNRSIKERN